MPQRKEKKSKKSKKKSKAKSKKRKHSSSSSTSSDSSDSHSSSINDSDSETTECNNQRSLKNPDQISSGHNLEKRCPRSRSRSSIRSSKKRKRKRSSSSSTSSSSSSSSPPPVKKKKQKKKSKKKKDHSKMKKKKKKKKSHIIEKEEEAKIVTVAVAEKTTAITPQNLNGPKQGPKPRTMTPMTKEEWEKQQSVVRRVYDEETGRERLVKGDGEILEEIVSKDRHKDINKTATRGDGFSYAKKMGLL